MHSNKSKDRSRHYDYKKLDRDSNYKFFYDINQLNPNKLYPHKDKRSLKHLDNNDSQTKQNEALFKNMEKCNEKMEFYKLKGSLEEQKRTMLQHQNHLLKEQNENLKQEIQLCHKQIKKLSRKLEKLSNQLQKYQQINNSKQNNFIIDLPNKPHKNNSKAKKSSPKNDEIEQDQQCEQCAYLEEKLQEERILYQKDRNYLKQQIQNLSETLNDNQRQQKIMNKELEGRNSFNEKKEIEILEKSKQKQIQLKKQLTYCYKAFQQKCKTISQLEQKIDYFQQQNHRILKLLTLFDAGNVDSTKLVKNKIQNFSMQKQERSKSTFSYNPKNSLHAIFYNENDSLLKGDDHNIIDNRRKNRKCGSIKKIEVD